MAASSDFLVLNLAILIRVCRKSDVPPRWAHQQWRIAQPGTPWPRPQLFLEIVRPALFHTKRSPAVSQLCLRVSGACGSWRASCACSMLIVKGHSRKSGHAAGPAGGQERTDHVQRSGRPQWSLHSGTIRFAWGANKTDKTRQKERRQVLTVVGGEEQERSDASPT